MSGIDISAPKSQRIVVNPSTQSAKVISQIYHITVNPDVSSMKLVPAPQQKIVVNGANLGIVVTAQTQKIIVNPTTSSVSVINTGPMGPAGPQGPAWPSTVLTVDGQLLTRIAGSPMPISRADLAADTAFASADTAAVNAGIATHVAAADPHPGYMTTAEDSAVMSAHTSASDPHPVYMIAPGIMHMFAGGSVPSGYLFCDGASYLRSAYPALFAALGGVSSPWGLPDGTHFNVPDMRSRAPIGVGTGIGLTARALAATTGEETHLLTGSESGTSVHNHTQNSHNHTQNSHNHTQDAHTHTTGQGGSVKGFVVAGTTGTNAAINTTGSGYVYIDSMSSNTATNQAATATNIAATATNIATTAANASTAHNNMQPSIAVNFIIKT